MEEADADGDGAQAARIGRVRWQLPLRWPPLPLDAGAGAGAAPTRTRRRARGRRPCRPGVCSILSVAQKPNAVWTEAQPSIRPDTTREPMRFCSDCVLFPVRTGKIEQPTITFASRPKTVLVPCLFADQSALLCGEIVYASRPRVSECRAIAAPPCLFCQQCSGGVACPPPATIVRGP